MTSLGSRSQRLRTARQDLNRAVTETRYAQTTYETLRAQRARDSGEKTCRSGFRPNDSTIGNHWLRR